MIKKNVLILGSSGFLGKHLSRILKDNFKLFYSHNKKNQRKIDITKKKQLYEFLIKKKIEIVINLSGQIEKKYILFKKVSIEGNNNLINFAKNNKILNIFFSSDQVYGSSNYKFHEKSLLKPVSSYGKVKKKVETLYIKSKTNFCILRISNVYDPRFEKRGFLNNLKNYFKLRKKYLVLDNADLLRNFIHINDFCNIIKKILLIKESKKRIINISHQNLYLMDIIRRIEIKEKKKINIRIKNKRCIPIKIAVDNDFISKKLKYRFKKDLKKCLIKY